MANRTVVRLSFTTHPRPYIIVLQILVMHHVELVLPGTYYIIRMLDGRIDTQGMAKNLRARGVLGDIAQDSLDFLFPIFSGSSELLEGINNVTALAFSAEQHFLDDMHGNIDVTTKVDSTLALAIQ